MSESHSTRREFIHQAGCAAALLFGGGGCVRTQKFRRTGQPKPVRVSKEVFIPSQNETGVFPGFITYVHRRKPILLHRFGWVDASDTYDNFHDSWSHDNGKTWSPPVLKLKSHDTDGGRLRYCENTAFFDDDTGQLITAVSKFFYPNDRFNQDVPRQLEIDVYDPFTDRPPKSRGASPPSRFSSGFGLPGGLGTSFCFPIKTASGRIVIPAMKAQVKPDGEFVHHPKSGLVIHEARMLIGEYRKDRTIQWRVGDALCADPERSTRGFSESTIVQLHDGRLAAFCRGSNYKNEEMPGHKWLSFSADEGDTWSEAEPLGCHDGTAIESSATGSACFRSIVNGKLYLIANLCAEGERADGNWPRSPLVIAELQEEPLAVKRETITVIDTRDAADSDRTQISNFRYYQDRVSGEVVVSATRFGENDAKKWRWANHYRYRVAVE